MSDLDLTNPQIRTIKLGTGKNKTQPRGLSSSEPEYRKAFIEHLSVIFHQLKDRDDLPFRSKINIALVSSDVDIQRAEMLKVSIGDLFKDSTIEIFLFNQWGPFIDALEEEEGKNTPKKEITKEWILDVAHKSHFL